MTPQKTLYFGHPINIFGTDLKRRLLQKIRERFPDWLIEDPEKPEHQEGYRLWKAKGDPMGYYIREVLPHCDEGIFLAFPDGKFGAGVHRESTILMMAGRQVWEIQPDGLIRPLFPDASRALTVEETCRRIRDSKGDPLPYA